jgi:tetratricopeptide (TPR) repeat protein
VKLRRWMVISILLVMSTTAVAGDAPLTTDQAIVLLQSGKRDEARQALQTIISARPRDPSEALQVLGLMDLEDGKWRDARPLIQQLMKLRPGSFAGWELMIQSDQAAGHLEDRDAAIQSLYTAWKSALDPAIRAKMAFARDRIFGPRHTLIAMEMLEPVGDDILRFLFEPADEPGQQRHLIVVRTDGQTNDRWREDGTIPGSAVVYHLDTLEQLPNGLLRARPYEFYLRPPDYDHVRAKVVGILDGTAGPLTGSPDPFWAGEPAK